ncbi:hypothetical protein EU527_18615 [Candidatus Thorarchaeota archaeon]|nr:MAG: hypothetical protein EU527_18615 [Candidatus Thorarchaeota archaeon]
MNDIIWKLVGLGQLALLLEASSPKPGNVNRGACFSDMDYRNFLTSAALISRGLYQCAYRGWELGAGVRQPEQVGLGELIELCVRDSLTGLNTKNTILGSILLYVPLTVAITSTLKKKALFSIDDIDNELSRIISCTSVNDSICLYKTFELTRPGGRKIKDEPEWTEIHNRYDFNNPQAVKNIIQDEVRLIDLFKISAEIDEISGEWANNFPLTLRQVLPYLTEISSDLDDIEEAIVRTYIWLLSKRPDGLIVKKAGRRKAEEVHHIALDIVNGWKESKKIEEHILLLDKKLRKGGNLLNPGTTADLISAATFCRLVSIYYSKS